MSNDCSENSRRVGLEYKFVILDVWNALASAAIVGSRRGFSCVEPELNRRVLRCLFCFTVALSSDGEIGSGRLQADALVEAFDVIEDRLGPPRAGERTEHESPITKSNEAE